MKSVLEIQSRLLSLGYPLPRFGADGHFGAETETAIQQFQTDQHLPVTGLADAETERLLMGSSTSTGSDTIPADWMPNAKMERVIVHWTAGNHKASALDKEHYHILIEADGNVVRGIPTIDLNQKPTKKGYAAHTLNCNSGSIGVSLCCMAGAVESPFNAGSAPMTKAQWGKLPHVLADLCRRYKIPVTPKTVLSHAEVQGTLGIKQKGKWDIARLAFSPSIIGATACGDIFRKATEELL